MAGVCENRNEPPGSIKCEDFLEEVLASKEELCSTELVS